ncbi:MAG: hypothetical protein DHS20C11_11030 [Lysobacteraceae bacterium]|nr:MAG: hypothetical protein DHS20C11_11030 [Xanthomonadaceae bacterium]
MSVEPDVFELRVTISAESLDLEKAEGLMQTKLAKILAVCAESNIAPENVHVATMSSHIRLDHRSGNSTFAGYSLRQQISIDADPDHHAEVMRDVLVKGTPANVVSSFKVKDQDQVLDQAQLEAVDDARRRAQRIAERAGRSLGEVYSISEFDHRLTEKSGLRPLRHMSDEQGQYMLFASAKLDPESVIAEARVFVVFLLAD